MREYAYLAAAVFFAILAPLSFLYGQHIEGQLRDAEDKAQGATAYVKVIEYRTKREPVYVEREKIIVREPGLDDPLPPAIAKLCIEAGICRPEPLRPTR